MAGGHIVRERLRKAGYYGVLEKADGPSPTGADVGYVDRSAAFDSGLPQFSMFHAADAHSEAAASPHNRKFVC